MAEIQNKLDTAFGKPASSFEAATGFSAGLSGSITPSGTTGGGFAPLKVADGLGVEPTGAKSDRFQSLIDAAARSNNVDPKLYTALIEAESDFDPSCRSKAGAMGLSQLMPDTAKSLGVTDPFNPQQNLNGGAKYLRQLLDKFGAIEPALAAYNAGPGAVHKYGGVPPYPETRAYVDKILAKYQAEKP